LQPRTQCLSTPSGTIYSARRVAPCSACPVIQSEEHVDWLETQLGIIAAIGLQNYLSERLGGIEEDEHE
jgi:hypothetical protein